MVKFLSFPIPAKKEAAVKAKKHRGEKLSYTRPMKVQVLEPTPVSESKSDEEVKPKRMSLRERLSRHED